MAQKILADPHESGSIHDSAGFRDDNLFPYGSLNFVVRHKEVYQPEYIPQFAVKIKGTHTGETISIDSRNYLARPPKCVLTSERKRRSGKHAAGDVKAITKCSGRSSRLKPIIADHSNTVFAEEPIPQCAAASMEL